MNALSSLSGRWVAAAMLALLPWSLGCDVRPVAQAATTPSPLPAAATAKMNPPETREIDAASFVTSGPLVAEQQADVAAERDGRVDSIAVEIGDHVRQGQLLASLDKRTLQATVESQRAKLASLRAQVNEWQSEAKMDGADLRRADQMRASTILSEEGWEHVKYKLDEANAEVARYQADEAGAEADLRSANLQLGQCQIVAPFTGVVGRQSIRSAQLVKKGDVLFWITAEAPLRILFTVPESVMSSFRTGANLVLTNVGYPGLRQNARILRVSPAVDPASGSVQVIGTLTHPSPLLKPGMSMQVAIAPSISGVR